MTWSGGGGGAIVLVVFVVLLVAVQGWRCYGDSLALAWCDGWCDAAAVPCWTMVDNLFRPELMFNVNSHASSGYRQAP